MGFNLGAFAGGLAKSGVDTYTKLSDEERRDAESKRQADIHRAFLQDQEENQRLRALTGETYGRVGQPEAFRTAGGAMGPAQPTPEQNAQAENEMYRNMGGRLSPEAERAMGLPSPTPGDAAKMFPAQKIYSADQAAAEFKTRAMGINPIKAADYQARLQSARKGELEITGLERAAKQDVEFDTYMQDTHKKLAGMRQDIQGTFDTDGMNGLVKKYGADFKDATGNSVALVGNAIVIKDSKGKIIGEPVTKPEDAVNALSNVLGKKAMESSLDGMLTKGLFRNSAEMMDYFTKRSTMRTQEATAGATVSNAATNAAQLAEQIKAGLFEAQAGQARASAASSTAHAAVYRNMADLYKSNKEAGEAVKPYLEKYAALSDKEKDGPEGRRILEEGALAAAKKSTDVTALINTLKKPDKSQAPEIDPKLKEAAYKEYAEAGTDPKALAAIKAKYPGVFGQSALDKALSGSNSPTAPTVEGRPLYNKTNDELLRMTKRAIGTSTSEAREAQAELDARKGESRMKAF